MAKKKENNENLGAAQNTNGADQTREISGKIKRPAGACKEKEKYAGISGNQRFLF